MVVTSEALKDIIGRPKEI